MTKDQGDAAELGIDPFAKLVSITSVRSVGDLVRASSDQASAEKVEMTGGNGSAGVAIVGIACQQCIKDRDYFASR
jgi:hypothetical protein